MLVFVLSIDTLEENLILEVKSYILCFIFTLTEFKLYTYDRFKAKLFI